MAISGMEQLRTRGKGRVVITGSFAPAGTGAVTDVRGKGFTVARSGVGTFLVTFRDKYTACDSANATVQLNASADTKAQVGAITTGTSTNTAVIRTITGASDADISANANNRVNFSFVFRNTSVDG